MMLARPFDCKIYSRKTSNAEILYFSQKFLQWEIPNGVWESRKIILKPTL